MSFIIGIVGTSGSGKTSLAKHLYSLNPDSISLLSLDNYFIGKKPEESLEDYSKRNFDVPEALDLELFCTDLAKLKQGQSVFIPFYDMKHDFTSYPQHLEIAAKPVIIIEGTMLFSKPEIRDLIDFKVFMKLSTGPALARRLLRDKEERNVDAVNSLQRYESYIFPSYRTHIKPYRTKADLIIDINPSKGDEKEGLYPVEAINQLSQCISNAIEAQSTQSSACFI